MKPTIGLYFTDTPPTGSPLMIKVGSEAIDIPAGQAAYTITDSFTVPVDVDVLSVYPHAHYLGKDISADATLPDGSTRRLLHIAHWDFHWQQDFRYVQPIALARGTKLSVTYVFDNSAANRRNPHKPPVPVRYGPNSHDEMGDVWLQVLPKSRADRAVLAAAFDRHEASLDIAGAEMLVRHDPGDAKYQAALGSAYATEGRLSDAAVHLEEAAGHIDEARRQFRLDPKQASAHNAMGGVLLSQHRVPEAVVHLREAFKYAPGEARMPFNLGNALIVAGQNAEAARLFQRAVAINPDFAPAHQNLGVHYASVGRLPEAIAHLKRAVEISPEVVEIVGDYAAVLAAAGHIDEARRQFRLALDLQPDYGPALENLAKLDRQGK
ncbi:MAG: tetratricopeptide repeat protein [Vicinamibacterales bacterium]